MTFGASLLTAVRSRFLFFGVLGFHVTLFFGGDIGCFSNSLVDLGQFSAFGEIGLLF